jgi:hypothetical protein
MELQTALQLVWERLTFGGACFLFGLIAEYAWHPTQRFLAWLEEKQCAASKRSRSIP